MENNSYSIRTEIIPIHQQFYGSKSTLDYKSICVFAALGFFLDDTTYFEELKVLRPAHEYIFESKNSNQYVKATPYFKWHYEPLDRPFKMVVAEFRELLETIVKEQCANKKVVLGLSGGLDSRSLAVALSHLDIEANAYSYNFLNGHNETSYAKAIAKEANFPLESWQVTPGYLWNNIDNLAAINKCYSEFTHNRQMAFIDKYRDLGQILLLGHWGDVLFDSMGVQDSLSINSQVDILIKKMVKKGGIELAEKLWRDWDVKGDFTDYLNNAIKELLLNIKIDNNANAQLRAFKSLYWAPRWTSVNMDVFNCALPISAPYYHNEICKFICSVPEKYLANRQIQIAYIKSKPSMAKIKWQQHRPFNLYNFHLNRAPYNLPYRIISKIQRIMGPKYIQRNWELQFLGEENDQNLKSHILENTAFQELVPKETVQLFYNKFKNQDEVYYSHPISVLLTLSQFAKMKENKN